MSGDYWETEVYGVAPLADLERADHEAVFDWLNASLPFNGSRIDWPSARGQHSHRDFVDDEQLASAAAEEVRRRTGAGSVVEHVGDSLSPFGVRFSGEDAAAVLAALLEVPEHHYFLDQDRSWLVVVTFERDLDTLDQFSAADGA